MSGPIDQLIVDEIARLLARISVANGYATDAGVNVLVEESREDIPANEITLEIVDETEALDVQSRANRRGTLTVTVDASIPKSTTARATARLVMADVRKALTVEPRLLPAGFTAMAISGRSIPPRQDGSQFLSASVTVTAGFNEVFAVSKPSN